MTGAGAGGRGPWTVDPWPVVRGPWSVVWVWDWDWDLDWIGFGPKSLYFLANPLGFQSVGLPPDCLILNQLLQLINTGFMAFMPVTAVALWPALKPVLKAIMQGHKAGRLLHAYIKCSTSLTSVHSKNYLSQLKFLSPFRQ